MSDNTRRVVSYTFIFAVTVIIGMVSNAMTDDILDKGWSNENTFRIGNVDVSVLSENYYNNQTSFIKYSDVIQSNFTMSNNSDEIVKVDHTLTKYLGTVSIFNGTTQNIELQPHETKNFLSTTTLIDEGNNLIRHSFVWKESHNSELLFGWGTHEDLVYVYSLEGINAMLIQFLVIKYAWALALPFVVISTRHLQSIWDGT
jgi:hypothetical protein